MVDRMRPNGHSAGQQFVASAGKPFRREEPWRKLEFIMQDQLHSNWCWAAVTASVAHYYKHRAKPTQCMIVNQEFERDDCCNASGKSPSVTCDVPHVLGAPLYRISCAENLGFEGQMALEDIKREIDRQRPICARVLWTTDDGKRGASGAHFVAIGGYLPETKMLAV
jgi:hypothetical protein